MKRISASERVFRLLLRLYPRDFRDAYGEEMARTFRDLLRDARAGDGERVGRNGIAALWARTLTDTFVCAVRERSDAAMRISALDAVLLPTATLIGLAITWVDSRPTWDDTGITAGAILLVCTCLGGIAPQRAWRWALAVGAWIPLHGFLVSHNYGTVLALAPAFLGAYAGAGVRRVIDPATGQA